MHPIEQPSTTGFVNRGIIDHHDPHARFERENATFVWLRTQVHAPPVTKTVPDQSDD